MFDNTKCRHTVTLSCVKVFVVVESLWDFQKIKARPVWAMQDFVGAVTESQNTLGSEQTEFSTRGAVLLLFPVWENDLVTSWAEKHHLQLSWMDGGEQKALWFLLFENMRIYTKIFQSICVTQHSYTSWDRLALLHIQILLNDDCSSWSHIHYIFLVLLFKTYLIMLL